MFFFWDHNSKFHVQSYFGSEILYRLQTHQTWLFLPVLCYFFLSKCPVGLKKSVKLSGYLQNLLQFFDGFKLPRSIFCRRNHWKNLSKTAWFSLLGWKLQLRLPARFVVSAGTEQSRFQWIVVTVWDPWKISSVSSWPLFFIFLRSTAGGKLKKCITTFSDWQASLIGCLKRHPATSGIVCALQHC